MTLLILCRKTLLLRRTIVTLLFLALCGAILLHVYGRANSCTCSMEKDEPIQIPLSISSLSKDVIVHSAYFDSRHRDGHDNVTVLFVNVNTTIVNNSWILGCGAGRLLASSFKLYSIFENQLMHTWLDPTFGPHPIVFENYLILCYDLPAKNGSDAFAVYKTSEDAEVNFVAHSRQPIFHPSPRIVPTGKHNFTVVVCSKVHDRKVPWLRDFIRYQKTLGVDHIDFSILDNFIVDDGYDDMVLKDHYIRKALMDGYINFRVWPESYRRKREVYFHSENLRKLACMYRYLGTYDFVMPLDTDDFFIPQDSPKMLKDFISQFCSADETGSCSLQWLQLYPDCGMERRSSQDGNITALLKIKHTTITGKYKSIHTTRALLDASFHDASCDQCLLPGFDIVMIPSHLAYIGHVRKLHKNSTLHEIHRTICSQKPLP